MIDVWKRLLGAGAVAAALLAGPASAQTKPYAGQSITVLLPPWGTLPKDMTDRFTGETGIAIDMQTLGWDDIRTKIVTSTLAGSAPADVTEVDWSWVGQFGAAGWYEPLDGVVSAALRQDAPTEKIFTFDGKLIAMPYNNDYRVLILNEAQTKKAGIDKAPTTPRRTHGRCQDRQGQGRCHLSDRPAALGDRRERHGLVPPHQGVRWGALRSRLQAALHRQGFGGLQGPGLEAEA